MSSRPTLRKIVCRIIGHKWEHVKDVPPFSEETYWCQRCRKWRPY